MDYKNKTAVVTGASSGLGVEYARELAKRGSNLVLVARRKEALDATKSSPSVIVGKRNSMLATASKFMPAKLVIGIAAGMFLKD